MMHITGCARLRSHLRRLPRSSPRVLQGGCRGGIECLDGLGKGKYLAVHQTFVEFVEVELVRPVGVACHASGGLGWYA